MGEVISLASLDADGMAAPPQLGVGRSQEQLVQAGEGMFPFGGAAGVAACTGQAPEPLARLLLFPEASDPQVPVIYGRQPRTDRRSVRLAGP
jgi:hypothetical protein